MLAAYVYEQGGTTRVGELRAAAFNFGYTRNDVSSASVRAVPGSSSWDACCGVLRETRSFSHELVMFDEDGPVWVGPVTGRRLRRAEIAQVNGRDSFQWLERRRLPYDRVYSEQDLTTIAAGHVADAMALDPRPGLRVRGAPTGVRQNVSVVAEEEQRAADRIRELTRAGLDIVTLARTVLLGDLETLLPRELVINDATCRLAEDDEDGLKMGTRWSVTGTPPGGTDEVIHGEAGGVDPRFGLVEQHVAELDAKDNDTANQIANDRWRVFRAPPRTVTAEIGPQGPTLRQLIPGARAAVRLSGAALGCEDVNSVMLLTQTDVRVDPRGGAQISATFVDLGTEGS